MDVCKPLVGGFGDGARGARGRAVQVDPTKPTLKAPGYERLKLEHGKLLSIFAFNFNLRRYSEAGCAFLRNYTPSILSTLTRTLVESGALSVLGRVLHSSTFRLNLSTFCEKRWLGLVFPVKKTAQVALRSGRNSGSPWSSARHGPRG